jgi:transcriptional regulator with XRE-family HTH domain
MSEQIYPGAPVMVKIDGSKVRAIREAKGLTQLYVATVVEVTTDTVSRWENRKYPAIKKENALKLALALEVELEDILDRAEASPLEDGREPAASPPPRQSRSPAQEAALGGTAKRSSRVKVAIALLAAALGFLTALIVFLIHRQADKRPEPAPIALRRIVAPHFIAGQSLPVFLVAENQADREVSLIIREKLPPGCRLLTASPPLSGAHSSDNTLKWLTKISGDGLIGFSVVTEPHFQGSLTFSGILKEANSARTAAEIGGNTTSVAGLHHWADTDGDNRISDAEILAVYDLVSEEGQALVNLDLLEEIWLGDGYIWQPELQKFTIIQ